MLLIGDGLQMKLTPKQIIKFSSRGCCEVKSSLKYVPPTSHDVRELITLCNWSYADVARLVGVSYNLKGSSPTVQRWCVEESSRDHRKIPYSAWRLLLAYSQIVAVNRIEAYKIIGEK